MRVQTAFNRMLRLPGASVIDVSFGVEGVIVTVRLRRGRRVCSECGQTGGQLEIHDRRVKRWRHLDLGSSRCVIECELRRLRCPDCGVRYDAVPWARADAHHTRDFEDVVAWLAQQMAKTPIAGLLRIGWDTVGRIVERVVAEHLDERRPGRPGRDRRRRDLLPPRPALSDVGRRSPSRSDRVVRSGNANKPMFRAFLLKEELRRLYQLENPKLAPAHLEAWLAWASRSRLDPFIKLARTIRAHRDGILAAIRLGLNNGRLEGLNSRIRLISHRSFGFHSAAPLIALVYLCCTRIVIELPR